MTAPPKSILSREFRYVSAARTDVRRTIAKELRRLAAQRLAQEQADVEAAAKVAQIKRGRA